GVEELNRLPNNKMVAYLLSVDKQVTAKQMLQVHHHNLEVLRTLGDERKRNAALASNDMVEKAIESQTKEFELEIEQEGSVGLMGEEIPGKSLEFGAKVNHNADEAGGSRRNRRNRNR